MNRLLDVNAVADLLSISKWTVRAYIRSGKLRAVRLGRRVLVEESELERFVASVKAAVGDSGLLGSKVVQDAPEGNSRA